MHLYIGKVTTPLQHLAVKFDNNLPIFFTKHVLEKTTSDSSDPLKLIISEGKNPPSLSNLYYFS